MTYYQALRSKYYITFDKNYKILQEIRYSDYQFESRFTVTSRYSQKQHVSEWLSSNPNEGIEFVNTLLEQFDFLQNNQEIFPIVEVTYKFRKYRVLCSSYVLSNNVEVKLYDQIEIAIVNYEHALQRRDHLLLFTGENSLSVPTSNILAILEN